MARALQLAAQGRYTTFPNPRVGCVIVRDGTIVGEGWHARAGEPHAEIHALRAAGERARGAELYVNLEPCAHHGRTPPCADALIAAGIARVCVALRDPNPQVAGQGIERLRAAGIAVEEGLLHDEARALNRGFLSRMERGRPWLVLKLAASLDGQTALASGESRWITGEAARADVQRLRAECGGILTGAGTVLADDPALNLRGALAADGARQPDRVVIDPRARVPAGARVWADGARRYWLTARPADAPAGVTQQCIESAPDAPMLLDRALAYCAGQGINTLLAECGAQLAGALMAGRWVDELVLYLAPRLLGEGGRPLARIPALHALADAPAWQFADLRQVGADLRLTLRPPA
jgi:diaminohydroxyphosphoribosylaminopyrimidine deaminase / 5-amino-6-(5-phosphoribosylamino)uracil reductase